MDREIERKIGIIHMAYGFLLGLIFGLYVHGTLTFLSLLVLGFVISFPLYHLTRKLFNLSHEEFQLKDWIKKGYYPFLITWVVVWVFVYNLLP